MLIGCCHCESESIPPSESVPPSESIASESQSESGSTANYSYGICGCVAVPVAWEVVWPTMDANAVCPILGGTYELTKVASETVGGCTWKSNDLEQRMRVVAGAWTCDDGTRTKFRLQVNPGLFLPIRIQLDVRFVIFEPAGFGSAYVNKSVQYSTADGVGCLHNGVLTNGGSTGNWPNVTDVTFPWTYITMPVPSTVTIRPKL